MHSKIPKFSRAFGAQNLLFYALSSKIPSGKCIHKYRLHNKFARLSSVARSKFRCISQGCFLYGMHKICTPKGCESSFQNAESECIYSSRFLLLMHFQKRSYAFYTHSVCIPHRKYPCYVSLNLEFVTRRRRPNLFWSWYFWMHF